MNSKHTRTQSDILTFSLRWLTGPLCICYGCELIYWCTFAVANVWNCSPMLSKETQRCWDSLARWKRWSDMRETMLRRVRCTNMTAYRLGTSQLGPWPTHSAQMHCSTLQRIWFQRTFMFTLEKHSLRILLLRVYFLIFWWEQKKKIQKALHDTILWIIL